MSEQKPVGVGDFLVWLLLCVVTFGVYTLWWTYSRAETVYRATADRKQEPQRGGRVYVA